jgi:octaprenyl-diphosphate synthase
MDIRPIQTLLSSALERTLALMADTLRSDISLLESTNARLREQHGKLLRPMLALLVAGACGGVSEDSIRFAAAAELMHNASLLHDDVIDQADERRGQPTVHTQVGTTEAVLLGDYWLTGCIRCLLAASKDALRVIHIYSKTLQDLAEGEWLQMEKARTADTTQEDYLRIIYSKTASLFQAAAVSGALSAGASEEMAAAAGTFARDMGIAFQIEDDRFDYSGMPSLGKPVGVDLREGKITQPLLSAMEAAPEEAVRIRALVRRIPSDPCAEEAVRAFVRQQNGVALAAVVRDAYIDKALLSLEALPASQEKEYLATLARYVGERDC